MPSQLPRTHIAAIAIFSIVAAVFPAPLLAGSFSVSPVRIYMLPRDRAVAITIVNEGDTEVALQADINTWSQKPNGADDLVLTEDLILSPPIIKLAPKARQVVRLALLKPADASKQLTYRLIVREVPEAVTPGPNVQIPIALALSMPVFITPPTAKREIACNASQAAQATQGAAASVLVSCQNTGTAYAQVREITLRRDGATLGKFEGGTYILPGAEKTIPVKTEAAVTAGAAQLQVTFDDGKSQSFSVAVP